MRPNAVVAIITLTTVRCKIHMFQARAMRSESWRKIGRVARIVLKGQDCAEGPRFKAVHVSARSARAMHPVQSATFLKCPSHCIPRSAPKAVKRLLVRFVYVIGWIYIVVELELVQTGGVTSCEGNVVLSILLTSIFLRGRFVVMLALGVRLDWMLTIKAELTTENKSAWMTPSIESPCRHKNVARTNMRLPFHHCACQSTHRHAV